MIGEAQAGMALEAPESHAERLRASALTGRSLSAFQTTRDPVGSPAFPPMESEIYLPWHWHWQPWIGLATSCPTAQQFPSHGTKAFGADLLIVISAVKLTTAK